MKIKDRIVGKWRMLHRDPVRFYMESHHPLVRTCGLWGLAAVTCLGDTRSTLAVLSDRMRAGFAARRIGLTPLTQLNGSAERWESTGTDPQFAVKAKPRLRRGGWTLVAFDVADLGTRLDPVIYVDDGQGFREQTAVHLPLLTSGSVCRLVKLPARVKALRFDPLSGPGKFRIDKFDLERLTGLGALRHLLLREGMTLPEALRALRKPAAGKGRKSPPQRYADWIAENDRLTDADRTAILRHIAGFRDRPRMSVLMPVHDPDPAWLDEAVGSVRAQFYPDWELCLVDDGSQDPRVHSLLVRHAAADPRVKHHVRESNGGIAAASNDALAIATGDWLVFLDHDDRLSEHALYMIVEALQRCAEAALVYSDYDHLTPAGERENPYFKPDWNYDLCLGQNLVNHLACFRRDLVTRLGGFREGLDGAQDWDLVLRVVEQIPGEAILHLPWVLYHWRTSPDRFSQAQALRAREAGRRAVVDHLARTGRHASVEPGANAAGHLVIRWHAPLDPPLVSVVIPTRDRLDLLRRCVEDLTRRTTYPKLELLIVDNGSVEPQTRVYYRSLSGDRRIRILEAPGEYNFSRLCNRGVAAAEGELYLLLNNDIEVIHPDWLTEMVSHAVRPRVGAVGAKLYYPDNTIQHAGTILGVGGVAGHAHKFFARRDDGYFGRAKLTQRLSAVTAACLLGPVAAYREVGGLDETNLTVAFNDVDFCLRLREAGYAVIWTPFAELYHHESASRGADEGPDKAARFNRERLWMLERWPSILENDPAYSPNLTLEKENFGLAFPRRTQAPWQAVPIGTTNDTWSAGCRQRIRDESLVRMLTRPAELSDGGEPV